MRNDIVDILLEIGIPAGVKGFTYIYDALELFDTDTYYSNGKRRYPIRGYRFSILDTFGLRSYVCTYLPY